MSGKVAKSSISIRMHVSPRRKRSSKKGDELLSVSHSTTSLIPFLFFPKSRTREIRPSESLAEDYTSVFLRYARLYAFAEKWDITLLKAVVLHKLDAILCEYKSCETRYGEVVALIGYTYAHTLCRERVDGLGELVTQYCGSRTDKDSAL